MSSNTVKNSNILNHLPIGIIAENKSFAYGYDGKKYYVTKGFLGYLVTRIHLKFHEAKYLYEALSFLENVCPFKKNINTLIKSARKQKLTGDDLFWHFENGLSQE